MKRTLPALALAFAALLLAPPLAYGHGDDHDDDDAHDRARARVLSGEILPLSTIVERAEREYDGDMIEAELESRHGRPVYEIKLLTGKGRVLKLLYDAGDGSLLKAREKR